MTLPSPRICLEVRAAVPPALKPGRAEEGVIRLAGAQRNPSITPPATRWVKLGRAQRSGDSSSDGADP